MTDDLVGELLAQVTALHLRLDALERQMRAVVQCLPAAEVSAAAGRRERARMERAES